MNCVNHNFARSLVGRFLGGEGMKMGGVYLMPTKEYKGEAFCDGRRKLLNLLKYWKVCGGLGFWVL
jgi:hypothetical protein